MVYVIDDDPAFRKSLAWLIESLDSACDAFSSAEQFLSKYDPGRVGCLVLDCRLPGMSGLALLETLKTRGSCLPAIVLTGYADTRLAVQALKLGAFDFVEKPFDESLPHRISVAIEAHARSLELHRTCSSQRRRLSALTRREREVMSLVVLGYANKVIASELGVSEKTVEVHRARVMRKLGVGSLAELVRLDIVARAIPSTLQPLEAHSGAAVPAGSTAGRRARPDEHPITSTQCPVFRTDRPRLSSREDAPYLLFPTIFPSLRPLRSAA